MAKVGVLGAGSWGTALAILLHDNGHDVTVWSIDPKEVEMLSEKREHVSKLPGVHISEEIMITNEMEEAIKGKRFLSSCSSFYLYKKYSGKDEAVCC